MEQYIQTAAGTKHAVAFCGVGSILGTLVFDLIGESRPASEIIQEFENPANTKTILYSDGRINISYTGYVKLQMFGMRDKTTVRINLAKEGE